jgi:sugar lactone lactonase YvrE
MKTFLTHIFLLLFISVHSQSPSTFITTNSEKDLIPEGIAVDPRTGDIYISSIASHKIVIVDRQGKCRDFIASDEQGFLEGLGMKVDLKRNLLWALSNKSDGKEFKSQIHAFDLTSAKAKHFYSVKDTIPHLFNDLDIDQHGNIYLTDMHFSAVYFLNTRKRKLDVFLKDSLTMYPNGIALGKNNQLFIATYKNGIVKIDVKKKTLRRVSGIKDSVKSHGLDGLAFTNNSLIGVYNYNVYDSTGFAIPAIVKYSLDETGQVIKEELLDEANQYFAEPTTLAVAGNKLFVLANSHLAAYNANKQSTKGIEDRLKPVTILQYQLH